LTVNQVLMHFRKCKVRPDLTTGDVELLAHVAASNQDPKQLGVVDRILLSEVIAKLPEGYRQVVILHLDGRDIDVVFGMLSKLPECNFTGNELCWSILQ
jgi:hypothetical protein